MAVAEGPAKKKGSKGLPKGIIEHRSNKLQARLSYKGEDGKTNRNSSRACLTIFPLRSLRKPQPTR